MAVVKVLEPRKNVSARTGRHDARPASLAASYYTWGRGRQREEMRGEWYGPGGPQTRRHVVGVVLHIRGHAFAVALFAALRHTAGAGRA